MLTTVLAMRWKRFYISSGYIGRDGCDSALDDDSHALLTFVAGYAALDACKLSTDNPDHLAVLELGYVFGGDHDVLLLQ